MPSRPVAGQQAARRNGADGVLALVIGGCSVPVGLLVAAVHGGGLPLVVLAFVALAAITAALTAMIVRAVQEPSRDPAS